MSEEAAPLPASQPAAPVSPGQDPLDEGSPGHEAASTPPAEVAVLRIGDISVSPHWVVTPNGTAPLAGSEWTLIDSTRPYTKHAWWTIVLAIVLFPLGLLFLFIGTEEIRGPLELKVKSGDLLHTTQLYVKNRMMSDTIRKNVGQVESMAHALADES
jgi:hypothetical protein